MYRALKMLILGAVQKWCHASREGEGDVTVCDKGLDKSKKKYDITCYG